MFVLLAAILACSSPHEEKGTVRSATAETPDDRPFLEDTDVQDIDTGEAGPCLPGMVHIADGAWDYCIDRYEAALADGSPYEVPTSPAIQATVGEGLVPQGYISGILAESACLNVGKRLCALDEWMRACQGPTGSLWPYGNTYDPDACNVSRAEHPVVSLFGADTDWSTSQMNDPGINQQSDSLDPAGANAGCVSAEGVYDLHGNLHEWISDLAGTFKGGFYADASINGDGCSYTTTAHSFGYHDYSTGFRCCSDLP